MIKFNVPFVAGRERDYIDRVFKNKKFSGDGEFTKSCEKWLREYSGAKGVLLTPSCTHALEMAALLADLEPGDEVIMPSYTFVSTANAFALRGAKIVFVDIRPDTLNIDEGKIEEAITENTKVIVPVHYAGVACEMDKIMKLAEERQLLVVEDAAQSVITKYKGQIPGAIGHLGAYSFHETKNIQCGEGGALLLNDSELIHRAEIIREKGTDRSRFIRGEVDKYTWQGFGSSYLISEVSAAFLLAQLEESHSLTEVRLALWQRYYDNLRNEKHVELPFIPANVHHNAHMFYIKVNENIRDELIASLKERGVQAVTHYVPLHETEFGRRISAFIGDDSRTMLESKKVVRLPLHSELSLADVDSVTNALREVLERLV